MSQKMNINDRDASYACLMGTAERELDAFMAVVTDLYGSEQAMVAAGDWIEELDGMDEFAWFEKRRLATHNDCGSGAIS